MATQVQYGQLSKVASMSEVGSHYPIDRKAGTQVAVWRVCKADTRGNPDLQAEIEKGRRMYVVMTSDRRASAIVNEQQLSSVVQMRVLA